MEKPVAVLELKKGREKPVLNKHPWIFSGAVSTIRGGSPEPGDIVDICAHDKRWLARGYFNQDSQIVARILTWQQSEPIDHAFWGSRIRQAIDNRVSLKFEPATTAYRLVNAESDGLPGLIVDRYGEYLVVQLLTLGADRRRDLITSLLVEQTQPVGIVERSDAKIRKREGLPLVSGILHGHSPPPESTILENDRIFGFDLMKGQKTGLYLDQRDNRREVCARNYVEQREILNAFSYTGGFSIYAAHVGAASITNIDVSANALESAKKNIELNGLVRPSDEYVADNAFEVLRKYRDSGRQFDMVILDPPKFAHSRKDISAACRGYKDLNWLAFRILRPNGLLATFSCSGLISADLFQKVIFGAAIDANRDVQIIKHLSHSPDHPVSVCFPESAYLKGFLCRVQ
ncbi:MAG TPA: class I SAM-dependent rRNA methyltransferase [candidate division Zixibacteria bacterium]|nr:class I SAM-dependent rRNA methyltransferase [candidate division Zixibacteria bacterium]